MNKRNLAVLLLAAFTVPVWADAAADDAEARRRGIPVAQLQAQRNLADEKARTASLQAQLDALHRQIADAQAKNAAASAAAAATNPAPQSSKAHALYKDIVRRYLAGDWEKLLDDAAARQKDFATLPQDNAADIAYIKDVVTESRQPWWDAAKNGKAGPQKVSLWKHQVPFSYTIAATPRFTPPAGTAPATVSWPRDAMDSFDPMSTVDVGLSLQGNFRKGDGINQLAWSYMGFVDLIATLGPDKFHAMSAADKARFDLFSAFWSGVTAGYYGTPPARRLIVVQALASFEEINDTRPDWKGRRPIGSAVLLEMKAHKYNVDSQGAMSILGLDQVDDSHQAEAFAAKPYILSLSNTKFTLEEDKHMRAMFKALAESNPDWTAPLLVLPNNLNYSFDAQVDAPLAKQRLKGSK